MLKSKTLWFALMLAVFGVLQVNTEAFKHLMTPEVYGYFVTIIGIIVAMLRVVTTMPLKDK